MNILVKESKKENYIYLRDENQNAISLEIASKRKTLGIIKSLILKHKIKSIEQIAL